MSIHHWQFMLVTLAGWINRHQQIIIEYLKEENRVLREWHGNKRPRFTDDQRRRLAAKANSLGRRVLRELETLITRHGQSIARHIRINCNRWQN